MVKRRDNGEARLGHWTLRLRDEDQMMFQAVNARLKKIGLTDGTKTGFFRYLLQAAYDGLRDIQKHAVLEEAIEDLQTAQRVLAEKETRLASIISEINVPPAKVQPAPMPPAEGST